MQSEATREYDRIRHLAAFTVSVKGRKLNQHITCYRFADGSELHIGNRYAKATDTRGFFVVIGSLFHNTERK